MPDLTVPLSLRAMMIFTSPLPIVPLTYTVLLTIIWRERIPVTCHGQYQMQRKVREEGKVRSQGRKAR